MFATRTYRRGLYPTWGLDLSFGGDVSINKSVDGSVLTNKDVIEGTTNQITVGVGPLDIGFGGNGDSMVNMDATVGRKFKTVSLGKSFGPPIPFLGSYSSKTTIGNGDN